MINELIAGAILLFGGFCVGVFSGYLLFCGQLDKLRFENRQLKRQLKIRMIGIEVIQCIKALCSIGEKKK